ncbi:arginine--tRNA ligase [Segnochrobactraceae bacterium EtOH-i3]
MNLFSVFTARVTRAATAIAAEMGVSLYEPDLDKVVVEPPRDPAHGDLATNAALVLSKGLGLKPRDLAARLVEKLAADADVVSAEPAGPGFINLKLTPAMLTGVITAALEGGADYGRSTYGQGRKVNVEYVSANPTGPMHVGHCRGAVVGDALASLMAYAGFDVSKEYYINDAGAQVDVLARSAYLRYLEAAGEDIGEIPEGLYPGDYLKPVGEKLFHRYGMNLKTMPESVWLADVKDFAIAEMMAMIRTDLEALNVRHDVFFSERSLVADGRDRVAEAIAALEAKGLIYRGTLPPPKGQLPEDWEDREQSLFRSTEFGDDVDRPLIKSDGSYTYFASDIAYHYDKYLRGFTLLVDVWGADHGGYVKRVAAAVSAMSDGHAELEVKLCQLVRLFRGGEPVKMSKRAGTFVTLRDVVEEVGTDAVRFMMLFRKNDATLDFDFQKVTEQSRDNPVFYVQYAHARCSSVLAKQAPAALGSVDLSRAALAKVSLAPLTDAGELGLAAKLAEWPRVVEQAAEAEEAHRIAFYLHDLASAFHSHWNRGKDSPELRFINPVERELTLARLALVAAVATVLATGLSLLGVSAPEELR